MLPFSIRARLAFWYAAVLAIVVGAVALTGYFFVARTTLENVDTTLDEAATAVASAVQLESSERHVLADFIPRVMEDFQFRDVAVALYDPRAGTLYTAERVPSDSGRDAVAAASDAWIPSLASVLARAPVGESSIETVRADSEPARLLVRPLRVRDVTLVIGAMHSLRGRRRLLAAMRYALAVGIPLMLLLATAGGYVLARKSLRPVAQMTERAAHIGASTLHERLPVSNADDELGRLATVFNDLLGRLDRSFEQQRQFMADASHELRTPVAIISGEAELALSRAEREPNELRETLATIRGVSGRMQRIVADLFLLARAEAGEQLLAREPLYLGELAADCVRSVRALAAERRIVVTYEGGAELPMTGDEALLRRVLLNLLDNAIKYTPAGGAVHVVAAGAESEMTISVTDTGRGVPADAQPHIFDRFYRHASRRGDNGGAGLGLAIARWIVDAHGGTLSLARSGETGSTFVVRLPCPRVNESGT